MLLISNIYFVGIC